MGGPERRDESVNFSLRELLKLEDERVLNERREHEKRQLAERAAEAERLAEEKRRAENERAERARAEANERERERLRTVEEEARREAMSRAAVEQARIAVEARTRAEEAERERTHELELAKLRQAKSPGTSVLPMVCAGLFGAVVTLCGGLAVYFAQLSPAHHLREGELVRDVAVAQTEIAAARGRLDEQVAKSRELEGRLAAANDEVAGLKTRLSRTPSTAGPASTRGGTTGPSRAPSSGSGAAGTPCLKGDPMCFRVDER